MSFFNSITVIKIKLNNTFYVYFKIIFYDVKIDYIVYCCYVCKPLLSCIKH